MPGLTARRSTALPPLRRVGHKGADLIAPGNTLASFDAALGAGVDMIEFDVLPEPGTDRLVLAHDFEDAAARRADVLTLEEALAHLDGVAFDGVELDVDLKGPSYEQRVVDALGAHDLLDRALISSQHARSLLAVRAADPTPRVGWSVPRVSRDYFRSPAMALPAHAVLQLMKRGLPPRAARALHAGRADAIMAHWRLVTPALVRAVARAGGELYVWTVDDRKRIDELERLGVTGVITNDPRLFAARAAVRA